MRYLSVCSGIEAASVAWHPLGWTPLAFSEIELFPRAVLAHHYPDTPLHGDFTVLRYEPWIADADVLVGGTPCQAFSVAGLRNSLADDRGNLTLEYVRLADAIDDLRHAAGRQPAICVWENVPGVLSVKDNAFGCFLAALAGDAAPYVPPRGKWTDAGVVDGPQRKVAWRILDAQYFGLAQRRRRVFVVASSREGFDPAEVLFEFEGVQRHSAPSREAGKAAPTIPSRSTAGGGLGTDFDLDGGVIRAWPAEIAPTLNAHFGEKQGLEDQHAFGGAGLFVPSVCPTLRAGGNRTGGDRPPGTDVDTADSLIVAHTLKGEDDTERGSALGPVVCATGQVTHALTAGGSRQNCTEDGTGRGTPLVPVGFSYKDSGSDAATDLSPTLRSLGAYDANGGGQMAVAFAQNTRDEVRLQGGDGQIAGALAAEPGMKQTTYIALPLLEVGKRTGISTADPRAGIGIGEAGDAMYTLQAGAQHGVAAYAQSGETGKGDAAPCVATTMAVRRLTARECERLQGFPDDYTLIPWRNKPAADCPDGPRYKALGNSMAVPCMRWIGERIVRNLRGDT